LLWDLKIEGNNSHGLEWLVALLDDLKIKSGFVDSLQGSIRILHELLADVVVEPSN
jgi:hypothetical protein